MPTLCLPSRPNLEHLKGQARTLQRQVRAGDKTGLEIVGAFHPRPPAAGANATFPLADAQLVVARQYGFPSWPALRRHLAVVEQYARYPHEDGQALGEGGPAADLLRLGCLLYGGDDTLRHAEARALLEAQPELAGGHDLHGGRRRRRGRRRAVPEPGPWLRQPHRRPLQLGVPPLRRLLPHRQRRPRPRFAGRGPPAPRRRRRPQRRLSLGRQLSLHRAHRCVRWGRGQDQPASPPPRRGPGPHASRGRRRPQRQPGPLQPPVRARRRPPPPPHRVRPRHRPGRAMARPPQLGPRHTG